jgi:hypothetical protein
MGIEKEKKILHCSTTVGQGVDAMEPPSPELLEANRPRKSRHQKPSVSS